MTYYSTLIVFSLLLPVVVQIVVPLLMLIGFGIFRVMRVVFWRRKAVDSVADDLQSREGLQFSVN